jgi:hypothetical protein
MKPGVILLLALLCSSCAATRFYHEGVPIAEFQGDMTGMEFSMMPDGSVRWKSATVDHSSATLAQGEAAASRLNAAGSAVAGSGLTLLLK